MPALKVARHYRCRVGRVIDVLVVVYACHTPHGVILLACLQVGTIGAGWWVKHVHAAIVVGALWLALCIGMSVAIAAHHDRCSLVRVVGVSRRRDSA
jgi:hypothetical protein